MMLAAQTLESLNCYLVSQFPGTKAYKLPIRNMPKTASLRDFVIWRCDTIDVGSTNIKRSVENVDCS